MNNRKYPPGPEIETIERLIKKRDDLQEENKHLRKLLRRVEWIPLPLPMASDESEDFCPICKMPRRYGHTDDCELAEEIDD